MARAADGMKMKLGEEKKAQRARRRTVVCNLMRSVIMKSSLEGDEAKSSEAFSSASNV